jgi:hypothetical protein
MLTYSSVDSSQRREGVVINLKLLLSAALAGLITTNSAASASAATTATTAASSVGSLAILYVLFALEGEEV